MSKAQELADILEFGIPSEESMEMAAAELRRLDRVNAELVKQNEAQKDEWLSWEAKRRELEREAARWRRLVNCSEMPFPIATVCDDPENDKLMVYGRKRLEDLVDGFDLIPSEYAALSSSGGAES